MMVRIAEEKQLPFSPLVPNEKTLEIKYCDHALGNYWKGYRDCHIKPDLVLLYRKVEGVLQLTKIGSHRDIGL